MITIKIMSKKTTVMADVRTNTRILINDLVILDNRYPGE